MIHPSRTADNRVPPASSQEYSGTIHRSIASNREQTRHSNVPLPFDYVNPVDKLAELISLKGVAPAELGRRIPVWHRIEKRKIVGNAAPLRKNLAKYIETHEQCEIYVGQEKWFKRPGVIDPFTGLPISESQRAVMWNTFTKTKITGSFSPTLRGLATYLDAFPSTRVYRGQDLIENAVRIYEEKDRGSKNRYRKKNINKDNMISCPLQAREVNPVGSEYHMKLVQTQKLGPDHPAHAHLVNNTLVTDVDRKEKVNVGGVDVSPVSEVLEAKRKMGEDASLGRNNIANTHNTITDFLFDIPDRAGGNSDPSEAKKNCVGIERSPSWSNLQLWRNPRAFHCPGQASMRISPSYAERSAVVYRDPIDWIIELGDTPLIDRDNKIFKSLLENHANVSLNFECNPEVELKKEDFLHDPYDFDQTTETDSIEYYLVSDDETTHGPMS